MNKFLVTIATLFFLAFPLSAIAGGEGPMKLPAGSNAEAVKHNQEGIDHWNQGHYDVALKHFQMASKIDPSVGESHYNEALALDKLGQHASASMHFKAARKNAHGRAEILNSGILMKHIGKEGS